MKIAEGPGNSPEVPEVIVQEPEFPVHLDLLEGAQPQVDLVVVVEEEAVAVVE